MYKFNRVVPEDIAISAILRVGDSVNARFAARSRTYQYRMHREKNPFLNDTSYFCHFDLDIESMNKAASLLLEVSDFSSFSKLNTQTKTNTCKVTEALWSEKGNVLVFQISADRFLRNMVRAIVGTLLEVGQHKMSIENFKEVIMSKNRSKAGFSVPAQGLFLTRISYSEEIFI